MVKRKTQTLIDSESGSDDGSASDLDSEFLSLANKKKRKPTERITSQSDKSGSDSDWGNKKNGAAQSRKKKRTKKVSKSSSESASSSSDSDNDDDDEDDGEDEDVPEGEKEKPAESSPPQPIPRQKSPSPTLKSPSPEKKDDDSEIEEGQVSSDSDSSSDSEFNDGFDENLMGDEEDRARLEGLSEKEREQEIFKRIERRDVMKTRWEIERKLRIVKRAERAKDRTKVKKKKEKKKEKPKEKESEIFVVPPVPVKETPVESPPPVESPATMSPEKNKEEEKESVEYFDPKERSKERKKNVEMNKTDDKRSNAMALLKARREGKAKREEEEAKRLAEKEKEDEKSEELEGVGGKSSVKLKACDIYSDSNSSSSDEEEKPSERRSRSSSSPRASSDSEEEKKTSKQAATFLETKEELNKIRLSRFKMERFVHMPIFDRVVTNCFVRISIGNHRGKPIYRVGEIVGIVETGKIYQLGKSRTNKGLKLKHGADIKVFRLEFISNQDFTDDEFAEWKKQCATGNVSMPTSDMMQQKLKDVKELMTYEFKEEDVDRMVEEKRRFRTYPTNYAMKKTCLMKERDAAQLRGEDDYARDLNLQIQELEERANELDKKRSSSISSISYINDRNRKRNVEGAERAIMEEVQASRGVKTEDPFTRRSTRPRMTFKAIGITEELAPMQLPPPPPGKRAKTDEHKQASMNPTDNSMYSLHDFEIDLDVSLPANVVSVTPKPVDKMKDSGPKRSLNLEDYKKKRGLI